MPTGVVMKNPQMQRLYGVAFATQEELDKHLEMLEQAKLRDHRKLGKEPISQHPRLLARVYHFLHPVGRSHEKLTSLAEQLRKDSDSPTGFLFHTLPNGSVKVSGHWDKFGDELFLVESQETSDKFAMKPMNCPHHNQVYASQPRSYRDLPIRYFETTMVYRDEKTGELGGLNRVRSITQDDSHAYRRPDQVGEEVSSLVSDIKALYGDVLGMSLRAFEFPR